MAQNAENSTLYRFSPPPHFLGEKLLPRTARHTSPVPTSSFFLGHCIHHSVLFLHHLCSPAAQSGFSLATDAEGPPRGPGKHLTAHPPGSPTEVKTQGLVPAVSRQEGQAWPQGPPTQNAPTKHVVPFSGPNGKSSQPFLLSSPSRKPSWWPRPVHLCRPPPLRINSHFVQRQPTAQRPTPASALRGNAPASGIGIL